MVELSSAGPGDALCSSGDGSGCATLSGDLGTFEMGSDVRRLRCSPARVDVMPIPGRGDAEPPVMSRRTVVFVEGFREMTGRIDAFSGVPVPLPTSLRGMGESRRIDREDGAR